MQFVDGYCDFVECRKHESHGKTREPSIARMSCLAVKVSYRDCGAGAEPRQQVVIGQECVNAQPCGGCEECWVGMYAPNWSQKHGDIE